VRITQKYLLSILLQTHVFEVIRIDYDSHTFELGIASRVANYVSDFLLSVDQESEFCLDAVDRLILEEEELESID
jgi:hypothetical protein